MSVNGCRAGIAAIWLLLSAPVRSKLKQIALCLNVLLLTILLSLWAMPASAATEDGWVGRESLRAGVVAFQEGAYQTAVRQFTEAIEADANYAAAYSNRCLSYIYLADYPAAVVDCTQALELNPRDTEAYLNRGLAHQRMGQATAALADYDHLLQLKPHDLRAYYNRGLVQAEQQLYREAIVDYGAALRQTSPLDHATLAEIHNDRGLAQLELELWPQAISDFTQAVQFNSADLRAYYNRGCAYHHQGNLVAAVEDFTHALKIAPNHGQAYLSRGLIQQQLGNTEAALADLEQAATCFSSQGAMVAYQQTLDLIGKLRGFAAAIG